MNGGAHSTYSRVAIWLHWIIALAVVVNIVLVLGREAVEGPFAGTMMGWHKAIGVTVLFLSLVRLGWRLTHRPPSLPATVSAWQKGASHALHWTFYLLIILLPLSGWAMSSGAAQRRPLHWFGLFDIPYLPVPSGGAVYRLSHDFHEIAGLTMIALVLLHVAAALKHHMIDRDDVLSRMVPFLSRQGR